jgi:hypothetical protein
MEMDMRRIGIAVLSLGICLAYVQAPFTHVHAAGQAEEHIAATHAGNLAFHIHLGQGRTGASLSDPGESQRSTNWYRFEVERPIAWSGAPAVDSFTLIDPALRSEYSSPNEPSDRLHYPPEGRPSAPRAPPSC